MPYLLVGHAHALAIGAVGRHGGTGNAVADDLKHLGVGMRMLFLRPSQVRAAPSAARSQTVAESAVNAEFVFAGLRCIGIIGQRITVIQRSRRYSHRRNCD